MPYLNEFLTIALVHLVAVASPGPDFAVVVRNSLAYGRRIAIYTSIGIGLAILLHVGYSLVGLSVVIATTPWLFKTFSYLAAGYLLYLAYGALKSGPSQPPVEGEAEVSNNVDNKVDNSDKNRLANTKAANNIKASPQISAQKALWIGFLTNGLNPKATLFFLSLFTAIIDIDTPFSIKLGYGIYLAIATGLWFCFLSYLLSTSKIAQLIGKKGYWLDRAMGVLLVGLAAKLVLG
ncbi:MULTISPECIES: LysE family translocator [Alteromonas]|uniref:LysE family translocator n=1 Tax=Alteromonas stellipolaris TaxID=233316 RepID=A0AAW7YV19_9ALTE|nr:MULTISPECIES: LysE family translocator [Alteromonas]AMJ89953.1 lysine transporter LysE [Alteromonas sp. Mac2]AMJ86094.1 lysine transporter LysE [Alteromonas sp. Mac1]MDO6533874.1 LysE family translocator [Alteromonas stellipolaris]MDO6576006.1 LysE family translocator [Alteromonas stellipolaris]MDO6626232.1 LysE family translocator [Alteromonas stellipolaris]